VERGRTVAPALEPAVRPAFDEAALEEAVAGAVRSPTAWLLLGGAALSAEMLEVAGRIAAKTGCKLLSEWANARQERGAGRVVVNRVPYPI